ncbi:MAG TPA: hypothetical protein VFB62_21105 [Polyangiaceae bacterium]|jgi:putative membrane protein|nr:hypothetical protein [Polyangiaceae bacterium]
MSAFFDDAAKRRVREAVERIEASCGAEVVVAVRKRSFSYRHSHYLFGFLVALALLSALLFLPQTFDIITWPFEIAAAFGAGALLCSIVGPLERTLTGRRAMQEQVSRAAKAAFVDLGISGTRDRSGLLIYVSVAERMASVVSDIGLSEADYREARAAIEESIARIDFDAFVQAIERLAEPLAQAVPRRADDINELPDEVAS